jgi:hypothetical protein
MPFYLRAMQITGKKCLLLQYRHVRIHPLAQQRALSKSTNRTPSEDSKSTANDEGRAQSARPAAARETRAGFA